MQNEHFEALERFWNDVVQNPKVVHGSIEAEAALVLPKNHDGECDTKRIKYWAGEGQTKIQIKSGSSHGNSSHNTIYPLI